TGTDANGCSNTTTVSVVVNTLPSVTASASASTICDGDATTLTGANANTYNWMPGSLSGTSVSVSPNTSTTFTVTGTDGNGCSNTSTVSIAVNALPSVTSSSSVSSSCAGETITLTGNGATSYNWMPGSLSGSPVTDAPTASTTYTVTGTDANGCSNTSTVSVTVNAPPVVTVVLANDTFCDIDGPTPLSGGSPAGGTYTGPGVSGNNFDASSVGAGTYPLVYSFTDVNGCSDSATQNIVVDICAGIATPEETTTIDVVPNPNNGDFILSFFVAGSDDYVIEIHNALGQIVYTEQLNSFSGQYRKDISLAEFGRGMYTIRVRSAASESVIRVITQ
ncbi:MAG TPA: T9SS type A sorting domain-containing protein, partial [Bacteroidia bacterium]|nr:T9SS type A sorting domain-containing protein [Bacteroidia bacterium]